MKNIILLSINCKTLPIICLPFHRPSSTFNHLHCSICPCTNFSPRTLGSHTAPILLPVSPYVKQGDTRNRRIHLCVFKRHLANWQGLHYLNELADVLPSQQGVCYMVIWLYGIYGAPKSVDRCAKPYPKEKCTSSYVYCNFLCVCDSNYEPVSGLSTWLCHWSPWVIWIQQVHYNCWSLKDCFLFSFFVQLVFFILILKIAPKLSWMERSPLGSTLFIWMETGHSLCKSSVTWLKMEVDGL